MEPGSASNDTPFSARTPPNCTCRSSTTSRAGCRGDDVASLPTSLGFAPGTPVEGPSGTKLASNWAMFVAGPLTSTLNAAGVITGLNYVTGCNAAGNYVSTLTSCDVWTSATTSYNYYEGQGAVNTAGWFAALTQPLCNAQLPLVCVCVRAQG